MIDAETDEIIREFLVESGENLDHLDRDLVELEQTPNSKDILTRIFRTFHTIKGTSGFFGFSKLQAVTHVAENLLARLRDGELVLDAEMTSGMLAAVDAVRSILSHIEQSRQEGEEGYESLVQRLSALAEGRAAPAPAAPPPEPAPAAEPLPEEAPPVPEYRAPEPAPQPKPEATETHAASAESSIRVDVALLDRLMNLVGELVLARNQLLQIAVKERLQPIQQTSQRLSLITSELQEGVMKTRMQPIGNVWSKLPRVVRDLALQCDKKVKVEMEGQETELDKALIEAIRDPLTHIVRNSVDHGIEKPEVRLARGKPAEGTLQLRAYHEGGQVNMEISDDGGGIDVAKLKKKAIERGLISQEHADRLGERESLALVFMPGFSTAEKVTSISGRGVGMDVVKTNIEKVGGAVEVQSTLGVGTTLRIKIPLTLAIIPVLIVKSGGERFAVPQLSLKELVRLSPERVGTEIHEVQGEQLYRLRGKLLPLVDLNGQLGLEQPDRRGQKLNIVVLQADERPFGLVVDEVCDTEEIVVKPLSALLEELAVFSGVTILGDGKVALIIDVAGLAHRASLSSGSRAHATVESALAEDDRVGKERQGLLLFSVGGDRRLAINLSSVVRIEEVPRAQVEWASGREVMQYRDGLLPLIFMSRVLGTDSGEQPENLTVLVCFEGERLAGLVVENIIDVAEETGAGLEELSSGALSRPAVVKERVTEIMSLRALMARGEV